MTKVDCSYGVHKFKPSRQKFFHIEKKNNNKTRINLKHFLATGFEFMYAVTVLYFSINAKM